jgi:uncharacterized membrane protein YfcA
MGLLLLRRFVVRTGLVPSVRGGSGDGVAGSAAIRTPLALPHLPLGVWLCLIGFAAGFTNGMSGAFGPVATTATALMAKGHPRYVVGSVNVAELLVALSVSVTILIGMSWSTFGWQLPLALFLGSLLTAPIGAHLASRLPERAVGALLALVLLGLNGASTLRALTG